MNRYDKEVRDSLHAWLCATWSTEQSASAGRAAHVTTRRVLIPLYDTSLRVTGKPDVYVVLDRDMKKHSFIDRETHKITYANNGYISDDQEIKGR